VDIKIHNLG